MQIKDREYAKHFQTIKQGCLRWGKNQSGKSQKLVQTFERANYGSNFTKLGGNHFGVKKKRRELTPALGSKKYREMYYEITEQQFLQDPTSSEDDSEQQQTTVDTKKQQNQKNAQRNRGRNYDSDERENSSHNETSRFEREVSPNDRYTENNHTQQSEQKSQQTKVPEKPQKKIVDLSFEDYLQQMNKEGLSQDVCDKYIYQSLTKQAANLLNTSNMKDELQKETSRRNIERLRCLLNVSGTVNEDNIDNPMKNGSVDVLTMSVFSRPCNNTGRAALYQTNLSDSPYKELAVSTAKGLFNPKLMKEAQKGMQQALIDAEKVKAKMMQSPKKQEKKQPPKKKGKGEPEEEEDTKPKLMTRKDFRYLSELRQPFKGENYEQRLIQLREVEDLKTHLANNNLNISADIIHKAIVLPEEDERDNNLEKRNYPRIRDLLLENPFAQPKKKKKGKKKRK